MSQALVTMMEVINKVRPRVLIGEGQGGTLVAMSSFPLILERACRDRAVTGQQMWTYRQAWSGVTLITVKNPSILPTSNHNQGATFEFLRDSFPQIEWRQPRGNWRSMMTTKEYLTPKYAEELGIRMGCVAERDLLPAEESMADCLKPVPVYFETDDYTLKGVCCVCHKQGCLGRCPNPECGLLMHYSCMLPTKGDGFQIRCPVCNLDFESDEIETVVKESDLPKWHEVEVGAVAGRRIKPRTSMETKTAEFPAQRWPSIREAQLQGYQSVKDWFVHRRRLQDPNADLATLEIECDTLAKQFETEKADESEDEVNMVEQVGRSRNAAEEVIPAPR